MATCLQCAAKLPRSAKFCPRCGTESVASVGLPWAGIAFVLAIVFAPVAVGAGFYWDIRALIWAGVAVVALMLLLVILAHVC